MDIRVRRGKKREWLHSYGQRDSKLRVLPSQVVGNWPTQEGEEIGNRGPAAGKRREKSLRIPAFPSTEGGYAKYKKKRKEWQVDFR